MNERQVPTHRHTGTPTHCPTFSTLELRLCSSSLVGLLGQLWEEIQIPFCLLEAGLPKQTQVLTRRMGGALWAGSWAWFHWCTWGPHPNTLGGLVSCRLSSPLELGKVASPGAPVLRGSYPWWQRRWKYTISESQTWAPKQCSRILTQRVMTPRLFFPGSNFIPAGTAQLGSYPKNWALNATWHSFLNILPTSWSPICGNT